MPLRPSTSPSGPGAPGLADIDLLTVLQALSDPVRLEMVRQLAGCADASTGLICGHLELPVAKSTGSHHLKILTRAGITSEKEVGTSKYISLRRDELEERFPGLIDSVLRGLAGSRTGA